MDYMFSLLPESRRVAVRSQVTVVEVPDASTRSLAHKLLDRPDILADIRKAIAGA